jgi:biopolymer transport protein ExbD
MIKYCERRKRKQAELLLVPMIDIFTVLVTFLLMTAVFSRLAILELDLPSAGAPPVGEPVFRLEVIVRDAGFELTNGSSLIAVIPKVEGEYDIASLSKLALSLKRSNPDADDASVLLEPRIEYDNLIQVMDAIRSAELPPGDALLPADQPATPAPALAAEPAQPVRVALFTDIAVGDAP